MKNARDAVHPWAFLKKNDEPLSELVIQRDQKVEGDVCGYQREDASPSEV